MRVRPAALGVGLLVLAAPAVLAQDPTEAALVEENRRTVERMLQGLGVALMGVGFWTMFRGGKAADLLEAMEATPVGPVAQARGGGYHAVQGRAEVAGSPLLAPRCRDEVVFYRYLQTEEWEQRDDNGHWRRYERVHKDETEAVPFRVVDGQGGAIDVNLEGARLVGKRLHREQVGASASNTGTGGAGLGLGGEYRNHRYVHLVEGLMADHGAYVLGPCRGPGGGAVAFAADPSEERPYVVSAYSQEELEEQSRDSAQGSMLLTFLFLGLAVLSLVASRILPPALH